jgi:fatty acid desaturase
MHILAIAHVVTPRIVAICAQVVIALSIAFVWIVSLPNIVNEFREYGLPDLIRNAVGAAKICLTTLLIAGIWYPGLVPISALLIALLMFCAQLAHFRARHSWQRYAPSLGLLLLSLFVDAVYSGKLPS